MRPIDSAETATASSAALTPAAYVNSLWSAKLLPAIENSAVDARTFLDAYAKSPADALARYGRRDASGPVYLFVKGENLAKAMVTGRKPLAQVPEAARIDFKRSYLALLLLLVVLAAGGGAWFLVQGGALL